MKNEINDLQIGQISGGSGNTTKMECRNCKAKETWRGRYDNQGPFLCGNCGENALYGGTYTPSSTRVIID